MQAFLARISGPFSLSAASPPPFETPRTHSSLPSLMRLGMAPVHKYRFRDYITHDLSWNSLNTSSQTTLSRIRLIAYGDAFSPQQMLKLIRTIQSSLTDFQGTRP